jgi:peptidoglycan/LPS O-acetylase OafA/YrhL
LKGFLTQAMSDQRAEAYSIPRKFYSLDVLRGLAALSIVFWHWKHFLIKSAKYVDLDAQPLYTVFFAFYNHGDLAVTFFFALSGFIFFWLYADRIVTRKISIRTFAVARFSRLYPLHLVTLIAVLIGQIIYFSENGKYFIYRFNDLYHFILNIFFVSSWGFERGYSFNGPAWSVSIEVLLYVVFFIACLAFSAKTWSLCLIAAAGLLMSRFTMNYVFWNAAFTFFSGGLVYKFYIWLMRKRMMDVIAVPLFSLTAVLWLGAFIGMRFEMTESMHQYSWWTMHVAASLLFLITILTSAILETIRGHLGARLSLLGDISYSTYLISFPLEIFFFMITRGLGVSFKFYYSITSLALFFLVLISISYLSHRYFERPVQKLIRSRFISPEI